MLPRRPSPPALPAMWLGRREPGFQHIPTLLLGAQDPHGASISQTKQGQDTVARAASWPGSCVPSQPAPTRGSAASQRAGRHVLRGSRALLTSGEPRATRGKVEAAHSRAVDIYPLSGGSAPREPVWGCSHPTYSNSHSGGAEPSPAGPARHATGTQDTTRAGHHPPRNTAHRKAGGAEAAGSPQNSSVHTAQGEPPSPGLGSDPRHRLPLTLVTL